jgi:serine/threonine protein kinase
MHNKTRKLRGGIHIMRNYNPKTAIQYFIKHASFSLFSDEGSTSVIIKGSLNQDAESPYRMVRTQCFHSQVRHILFKFFVLARGSEKKITTSEDIRRETENQQFIYSKTFYHPKTLLEPLCPAIVYSHPEALDAQTKQIFLSLFGEESIFSHNIGFIAMECMDGYKKLTSLNKSPKYEFYKIMAIYELSKLHKLGYMHNDFHFDNVLIHETYNYIDLAKSGRAILIDFGDCIEVPAGVEPHKLLEMELGVIPSYYMDNFAIFDIKRQHVQSIYIGELERKLKHNIQEYIKQVILYKGGFHMKSNMPTVKKQKHEWTFVSQAEMDKIMSDLFLNNFKNNPDAYREFNNGIESYLQEEKKDPHYFEHLMKAQTANLIVKRG